VTNTGIAFGLFREWGSVLVAVAVVVIAFLLLYTRQLATARWPVQIALGLQLGGAFGNLLDRLRFGFVTDFLDFKFWPVFNLADSAIVVGMVLLLLFLEEDKARAPAASPPPEDPGQNP
jgi:signal peptidase II